MSFFDDFKKGAISAASKMDNKKFSGVNTCGLCKLAANVMGNLTGLLSLLNFGSGNCGSGEDASYGGSQSSSSYKNSTYYSESKNQKKGVTKRLGSKVKPTNSNDGGKKKKVKKVINKLKKVKEDIKKQVKEDIKKVTGIDIDFSLIPCLKSLVNEKGELSTLKTEDITNELLTEGLIDKSTKDRIDNSGMSGDDLDQLVNGYIKTSVAEKIEKSSLIYELSEKNRKILEDIVSNRINSGNGGRRRNKNTRRIRNVITGDFTSEDIERENGGSGSGSAGINSNTSGGSGNNGNSTGGGGGNNGSGGNNGGGNSHGGNGAGSNSGSDGSSGNNGYGGDGSNSNSNFDNYGGSSNWSNHSSRENSASLNSIFSDIVNSRGEDFLKTQFVVNPQLTEFPYIGWNDDYYKMLEDLANKYYELKSMINELEGIKNIYNIMKEVKEGKKTLDQLINNFNIFYEQINNYFYFNSGEYEDLNNNDGRYFFGNTQNIYLGDRNSNATYIQYIIYNGTNGGAPVINWEGEGADGSYLSNTKTVAATNENNKNSKYGDGTDGLINTYYQKESAVNTNNSSYDNSFNMSEGENNFSSSSGYGSNDPNGGDSGSGNSGYTGDGGTGSTSNSWAGTNNGYTDGTVKNENNGYKVTIDENLKLNKNETTLYNYTLATNSGINSKGINIDDEGLRGNNNNNYGWEQAENKITAVIDTVIRASESPGGGGLYTDEDLNEIINEAETGWDIFTQYDPTIKKKFFCPEVAFIVDHYIVRDPRFASPIITESKLNNLRQVYNTLLKPIYIHFFDKVDSDGCTLQIITGLCSQAYAIACLGGHALSRHIFGQAVDFNISTLSPKDVYDEISSGRLLLDYGVLNLNSDHIHITLPYNFKGRNIYHLNITPDIVGNLDSDLNFIW